MIERINWIPVNQSNPNKSGKYLVTIKSNIMDYETYHIFIEYYNYDLKKWDNNENNRFKIIAWFPLPDMYSNNWKYGLNPNKSGRYLTKCTIYSKVFINSDIQDIDEHIFIIEYRDKKWKLDKLIDGCQVKIEWMPLPDPYKPIIL